MTETDDNGPLSGLKVIEVALAMAGPYCGLMLADYGAEVIKVEREGRGDESRHWPPYFNDKVSHYFAAVNRNKKSIAVDLKSPEGIEVIRKLAKESDILLDNFRIGVLDRLGLGYDELKKINPRLIYCSISGFGATGPRKDERANDAIMQAYSGGMNLTGYPDQPPAKMGISVADIGAGMFGTIGILMALEARHRTGKGQRVDTSLLEGQVAMMANHYTSFFSRGTPPTRKGSSGQGMVPYQAFLAKDDWMAVASFTEVMWAGVCRAIEKSEWTEHERYCNANKRYENRDELIGKLSDIFAGENVAHWEERMYDEGVPFTRVNSIDRVAEEEQVLARDMIRTVTHPEAGELKMAGLPIKFSDTSDDSIAAPPLLGQDSTDVLTSLGYDQAATDKLIKDGVIGVPSTDKAAE
jgi:crotonobetainyl-CoA:carnitine CoA-transferase CaiB-like acyl-CoA transferase